MAEHPLLTTRYRARFVGILFLVCFLNLADRTVLSVLAPLIRVDLALSDTQLGLLQGLAFALLYGGLGLPIGWLAERRSRVGIIAVATACWSVATAFSGMATNFGQMLLSRIGVGLGRSRLHGANQFAGRRPLPARAPRQRHGVDHAGAAHRGNGSAHCWRA